jgi:hypothetical protein
LYDLYSFLISSQLYVVANSIPVLQFVIRKADSGIGLTEQTIAGIDWEFNAWGGTLF